MVDLARLLARFVWWRALRFMRLPWVRRVRRWWLRSLPDRTAQRMIRQDRFARRYGVAILTFSLTIALGSVTVTGCYLVALALVQSGVLAPLHP